MPTPLAISSTEPHATAERLSFRRSLRTFATNDDLAPLCRSLEADSAYIRSIDRRTDALIRQADAAPHLGAMVEPLAREVAAVEGAAHPPAIFERSLASTHLKRAIWARRDAWRLRNAMFDAQGNGRYPVRNAFDEVMRVVRIASKSNAPLRLSNEQVKPFIRFALSDAERAELYDAILDCRKLEPGDVPRDSHERALIGQHDVRARIDLEKGQCVGIYGGRFLTRPQAELSGDSTYLMSCVPARTVDHGQLAVIDGDMPTSRINSIFEYDRSGKAVRQAQAGYNVYQTAFEATVRTPHGDQTVNLPALFTARDIKRGESLRITYGYTPEQVARNIS